MKHLSSKILLLLFVAFSFFGISNQSSAQCDNTGNYGMYPGAFANAPVLNATLTISTCNYAGEYSQVTGGFVIGGT